MSASLRSADRNTHIRIVVVALIASLAIVAVAISARMPDESTQIVVIKAGAPTNYTEIGRTAVR